MAKDRMLAKTEQKREKIAGERDAANAELQEAKRALAAAQAVTEEAKSAARQTKAAAEEAAEGGGAMDLAEDVIAHLPPEIALDDAAALALGCLLSRESWEAEEGLRQSGMQVLEDRATRRGEIPNDVGGDDHCQFRSLARQLRLSGFPRYAEIGHDTVRQDIVRYMRKNRRMAIDAQGGTMEGFAELKSGEKDFEAYLKRMAGRQWGDHLTLRCAAALYKARIHVLSSLPSWGDSPKLIPPIDKDVTVVRDLHLGHYYERHWVSIEPMPGQPAQQPAPAPAVEGETRLAKPDVGRRKACRSLVSADFGQVSSDLDLTSSDFAVFTPGLPKSAETRRRQATSDFGLTSSDFGLTEVCRNQTSTRLRQTSPDLALPDRSLTRSDVGRPRDVRPKSAEVRFRQASAGVETWRSLT